MKTVGDQAPLFELKGIVGDHISQFSLKNLKSKWLVLFFYPKDFTFICPTEVKGFNEFLKDFTDANCEVMGVSVDSVETHRSWSLELGGIDYPLLCDEQGEVSRAYGVFDPAEGVSRRANFIIKDGLIQYSVAYHVNVGRSVEETLRVIRALQTGKLCPAGWTPGTPLIETNQKF